MSGTIDSSYKRALGDEPITFPRDFGPHPDYQTEWWYYTGNLHNGDGRSFGYELTIFRSGLAADSLKTDSSDWKTRHLYMGHLALSDIQNEQFYSFERYSRGAAGLAGSQADPFRVWIENWSVRKIRSSKINGTEIPVMKLTAEAGPISLDLQLESGKPPVLQGDNGWDRKGSEPGNASYYFSLTRLQSSGSVEIEEQTYQVKGTSWMDREWSTSALGEDQEGWDWFALQLSGNLELMYYRLRNKDGSSSSYSSGVIVNAKGEKQSFSEDQVSLQPLEHWQSPTSQARYPVRWRMKIPDRSISLTIIPKMKNQELQTQFKYWEGAVRVEGTIADTAVQGEGYVELTGY